MTNNFHWCEDCEQCGVPTVACNRIKKNNENPLIPRVSFGDQDSDTDKIYILKEHLNGIINTVSSMRYGSADKKQFNATLEHNLNEALKRQKAEIIERVEKLPKRIVEMGVDKQGMHYEISENSVNLDDVINIIKE